MMTPVALFSLALCGIGGIACIIHMIMRYRSEKPYSKFEAFIDMMYVLLASGVIYSLLSQ